jgi:hypothetical protein
MTIKDGLNGAAKSVSRIALCEATHRLTVVLGIPVVLGVAGWLLLEAITIRDTVQTLVAERTAIGEKMESDRLDRAADDVRLVRMIEQVGVRIDALYLFIAGSLSLPPRDQRDDAP